MSDTMSDAGTDEPMRLDGIVEVIAKRIGYRVRHHDAGGKMDNRINRMSGKNLVEKAVIADITLDKRHFRQQEVAQSCGQIIQHDDPLATIVQGQYHMAADITRPACHQNRHGLSFNYSCEDLQNTKKPHSIKCGLILDGI